MKKLIIGLAAVGAVMALRPRLAQKMRDHCTQMAGHCKEMMGDQSEATSHEAMQQKMRKHCEGMAPQHEEDVEPVATA